MTEKVVRLLDYDKKSRQPDSAGPRDPADADVIVLEQVRSGKGKTAIPSDVPFEVEIISVIAPARRIFPKSRQILPSNDFLFFGTYPDY